MPDSRHGQEHAPEDAEARGAEPAGGQQARAHRPTAWPRPAGRPRRGSAHAPCRPRRRTRCARAAAVRRRGRAPCSHVLIEAAARQQRQPAEGAGQQRDPERHEDAEFEEAPLQARAAHPHVGDRVSRRDRQHRDGAGDAGRAQEDREHEVVADELFVLAEPDGRQRDAPGRDAEERQDVDQRQADEQRRDEDEPGRTVDPEPVLSARDVGSLSSVTRRSTGLVPFSPTGRRSAKPG